ncbi:MAG TPA: TonB-dependent receptor [Flavisolibacter sp.]|nr:TonB-dependent receptor [Flavisolibacter sp.]
MLFAQQSVRGKITGEGGAAVPGATVQVKGTSTATQTDATGQFSINAPANSTLIVSSVGFEAQEIRVGNRSIINTELRSTSGEMQQVVVVGYGTQRKATLTGSVTSVKGAELQKSPTMNVSNSLAGRLPGLVTVSPSGEPGYDNTVLRIRGVNTLNNNNPLVVVDGIPGRDLNRIDPATIESISVLKDASAAIYGAQAANGVILVTTRRGRTGKPTITASFNQGYGRPTRVPQMADATTYATMLNEINFYRNVPDNQWISGWNNYANGSLTYTRPNGTQATVTPIYSQSDLQKYSSGSDPWTHPNTNWFDAVLRPWSGQNYANVSMSGGSDNVKYFMSLSSRGQEGYYHNSGVKYNQYDFRTNLDANVNKNISIAFDVMGRLEDRNFPTRSAGEIFRMTMRGKPNMTAYWPNGMPGPDIEYGDNPVVVSTKATGYDQDKRYVVNTNGRINIKIPWVQGLSLSANAGIDNVLRNQKTWRTPWNLYSFAGFDANNQPILNKSQRGFPDPSLTKRMEDNQNILLNGLVNYETKLRSTHGIRFLLGAERITAKGENFTAFRRNFISTALDQMFAGATDPFMSNNGSAYSQARLNYFGRVNYDFREKFLAEFVWRYQGSYIFPEKSRWGFFPGISLGYKISDEGFWKEHLGFVSSMKIRGSWGRTGNDQIDEWQYLSIYDPRGLRAQSWNNALPFITNTTLENVTMYEANIPNPNITWEKANQSNIGFDAIMLHNKLSITADYFNYKRTDILWARNASVPTSTGMEGLLPRENIGEVVNKGFDFQVTYNDRTPGGLTYQLSLNGGYQKNKIIFFDETPGNPEYKRATGKPIGSGVYYKAIGIFNSQDEIAKYPAMATFSPKLGDVIFEDVNGDGKVDANDQMRVEKNDIPKWTGGFNVNVQYKGFDFTVLAQGAAGAVRYINTESGEIGNFMQSFAANRWTPTNPNASGPRTFNRGNEYWVGNGNTYWLHKTDYIRLKNIELGYNVGSSLVRRAGIQNLRVYINAFNLLTYSPGMKDFDPELGAGNGQGYPLQKIVNGGISVTF